MQLIFLALQKSKETLNSRKRAVALQNHFLLFALKLKPRNIEGDALLLGEFFEIGGKASVLGFGPWFNCPLRQRLRGIGNHQVHIEINGVAKALASWTSPKRIIERE